MRVDLKATAIAMVVYFAVSTPMYIASVVNISAANAFASPLAWLPYIAAFFSGLTVAYQSRCGERINCFFVSVLISVALGIQNYLGPSDLPGASASLWISGLSFPVVVFLVVAGLGSKGFFNSEKPDENET